MIRNTYFRRMGFRSRTGGLRCLLGFNWTGLGWPLTPGTTMDWLIGHQVSYMMWLSMESQVRG